MQSLYTWNAVRRSADPGIGRDDGYAAIRLLFARSFPSAGRMCEAVSAVVYGYQPLMTITQCLVTDRPAAGKKPGSGISRTARASCFPVRNDCMLCPNTIYNSVPLDLVSLSGQVRAAGPASDPVSVYSRERRRDAEDPGRAESS